jgi:hypothetical protein
MHMSPPSIALGLNMSILLNSRVVSRGHHTKRSGPRNGLNKLET